MITILSPEQKEAGQAFLRAELRAEMRPQLEGASVRNVETLDRLAGESVGFTYRGLRYEVGLLPFREGVELQRLWLQLQQLEGRPETSDSLTELLALLERLAAFVYRNARPAGRRRSVRQLLRRALYRVLPNPFHAATSQEFAHLVLFFSACRMMSSVRYASGSDGDTGPSPSTPPGMPPRSPGSTPSG